MEINNIRLNKTEIIKHDKIKSKEAERSNKEKNNVRYADKVDISELGREKLKNGKNNHIRLSDFKYNDKEREKRIDKIKSEVKSGKYLEKSKIREASINIINRYGEL